MKEPVTHDPVMPEPVTRDPQKENAKPPYPLTKKQERQYLFTAMLTALVLALIMSAVIILVVLFCIYVWL